MKRLVVLFLVFCISSTAFVYADSEKQMEIFFDLLKAQKYTEAKDFIEKWKKDAATDSLEDKKGIEVCEAILTKVEDEPDPNQKIAIATLESMNQLTKGMEDMANLAKENEQELKDFKQSGQDAAQALTAMKEDIESGKMKFREPYTSPDPTENLISAVVRDNVDKVQEYLDKGADINKVDTLGFTPLMLACYKGNLDIVKMLLNHGAVLDTKNELGETALDIAKQKGNQEIVDLISSKLGQ